MASVSNNADQQARIAITGAAGFIGSHTTAALLADGCDVLGLDNFDPFYDRATKQVNLADLSRSDRFAFREVDIRDAGALTEAMHGFQPTVIVHLAALAGVRPSLEQPQRYVDVNINGTVNVLEAARACGCDRVVCASSSSVYGDDAPAPFCEDFPAVAPISPYAATKRAGELLCETYAARFGLTIASLRFFTVYGPKQRPDLAICKFMRKLLDGQTIEMFGDGTTSRDYTYIDDIVAGTIAALHRTADMPTGSHRIWNLGGSSPVSLRELIDAIAAVVGVTPNIKRLPMQPGDARQTFADLTRSREELGYAPCVALAEGLQRQWQWLQQCRTAKVPS